MLKLTVLPSRPQDGNIAADFLPGDDLLGAISGAGIRINAHCGHRGICGKCRVQVVSGALSAETEEERKHLGPELLRDGWVLACRRRALGDCTICVPLTATGDYGSGKQLGQEIFVAAEPHVRKHLLRLNPASLQDQTPDLERIMAALPEGTKPDSAVIREIPRLIREGNYEITAAVFRKELIRLEPGDTTGRLYGIAFDVGTTTVAGYLGDLNTGKLLASASTLNRQSAMGADVITRVSRILEYGKALDQLQKLIVESLNSLIGILLEMTGVDRSDIFLVTSAGNTTMSHLLLGVSPASMAVSPFIPAFRTAPGCAAAGIGLELGEHAVLLQAPNIAGFVGSDTVAAVTATQGMRSEFPCLLIDIGTNAELVLFTGTEILTCSTAAGPAFEGAGISCGMRAEPGAIESVEMGTDVEISTVKGDPPRGVCGSGLLDTVSELVRLGIVTPSGRIRGEGKVDDLPPALRSRIDSSRREKKFIICKGKNEVAILQKDIRELQLAKGAIQAGIEILMREAGIPADVLASVILTGAFGSRLRTDSLKNLGVLSFIGEERIKQVDNAAGMGAFMYLVSKSEFAEAVRLAPHIRHVELALHDGFQKTFIRCLELGPGRD